MARRLWQDIIHQQRAARIKELNSWKIHSKVLQMSFASTQKSNLETLSKAKAKASSSTTKTNLMIGPDHLSTQTAKMMHQKAKRSPFKLRSRNAAKSLGMRESNWRQQHHEGIMAMRRDRAMFQTKILDNLTKMEDKKLTELTKKQQKSPCSILSENMKMKSAALKQNQFRRPAHMASPAPKPSVSWFIPN